MACSKRDRRRQKGRFGTMRAWTFQDHRQKKKLGDKAPWSAGWIDPEGSKRSKRIGSKSRAEKYARKKEGELAAGTYQNESRKHWASSGRSGNRRSAPAWSRRASDVHSTLWSTSSESSSRDRCRGFRRRRSTNMSPKRGWRRARRPKAGVSRDGQ